MQRQTIGIIGGGQLGRMLIQAGINYPIDFHVYSNSEEFSSKGFCKKYHIGDLNDYNKIIKFGKECDIITIEIENVNVEALKDLLNKHHKIVYPSPQILETIKDRKLQKNYLSTHGIPTMDYIYYKSSHELNKTQLNYPCVNKLCIGGYDGYGTKIIKNEYDHFFSENSIIEEYCKIDREISVIISRNIYDEVYMFPPVEMKFNHQNMLDHLICPAENLDYNKINSISSTIAKKLDLVGLLAIEMFESNGKIYVNEMAPRPHNSGHHTQDMFNFSQFDIFIKCLLNLPLPICVKQLDNYGASINILGNPNIKNGKAIYQNLDMLKNVNVHIYDKRENKPYRKMGHVNLLANNKETLIYEINEVKKYLKNCISISHNNHLIKQNISIGIIMGSKSDLPVMQGSIDILEQFNIPYEVKVVSAHRTPEMMLEYGKTAQDRGLQVIIAGAGGAAHLPGMIASCTSLPVIGVPIKSSNSIDGWDSILSILQMPNGIPVATMNLNGSTNAGLLAARMIGNRDTMDKCWSTGCENDW